MKSFAFDLLPYLLVLVLTAPTYPTAGISLSVLLQTTDSATIYAEWVPVGASGDPVTVYEIQAFAAGFQPCAEDPARDNCPGREMIAHDTVTGTTYSFPAARPTCCFEEGTQEHISVRVRGHYNGLVGPWTPTPLPVVSLSAPPTIDAVDSVTVDTIPPGGSPVAAVWMFYGVSPDSGMAYALARDPTTLELFAYVESNEPEAALGEPHLHPVVGPANDCYRQAWSSKGAFPVLVGYPDQDVGEFVVTKSTCASRYADNYVGP